jgi:hypothetical protein
MTDIPDLPEHLDIDPTWGLMHELAAAENRAAIMLLGLAEAIWALKDSLNAPKDQEK